MVFETKDVLPQAWKDFMVLSWFLLPKLIAGKSNDGETKWFQLLVQCIQFYQKTGKQLRMTLMMTNAELVTKRRFVPTY